MSRFANNALLEGGVKVRVGIREQRENTRRYCNVIGLHCIQCGGTRLVYAVHQTIPFLVEVSLACKTTSGLNLHYDAV